MITIPDKPEATESLRRLISGNDRFVAGGAKHHIVTPEMLAQLGEGQKPFAVILGCSDSRVPPELVFDTGLGELFVIRVAGNVLFPDISASLQYAGVHLKVPLFVVLGHEGCGAIQATLQSRNDSVTQHSRIQDLVESIAPGLPPRDSTLSPAEELSRAVEANVRWTVNQILETPEGKARLQEGNMHLTGAIYELASGRVRFLT